VRASSTNVMRIAVAFHDDSARGKPLLLLPEGGKEATTTENIGGTSRLTAPVDFADEYVGQTVPHCQLTLRKNGTLEDNCAAAGKTASELGDAIADRQRWGTGVTGLHAVSPPPAVLEMPV
jgi:hypothetical protein